MARWLAFLALVIKRRIEERWMRETFPDYAAYRRETAALVPFVYSRAPGRCWTAPPLAAKDARAQPGEGAGLALAA
jgi:hypothetical protein